MKTTNRLVSACLAGFCLAALTQFGFAQSIPSHIARALAADARTAQMTERDADRKPGEVLALSGIEPGDTVVEFAGFGHYYTTILSEIVGEDGQVHIYDLPYTGRFGGEGAVAFVGAHSNTSYHLGDYNDLPLPRDVDVVYNVLYYHDLMLNDIDVAALNAKIFAALKPGGVFLIIDHNARPGSGTADTAELHRIDPEVIKREVMAAGFELDTESDLLAHPDDNHSQGPFSEDIRGKTDRTVFRFVKP